MTPIPDSVIVWIPDCGAAEPDWAIPPNGVGTMTQVNIAGIRDVEVDVSRFTDEVKSYVFNYGLKQMLNDVHASITAKVEPNDAKRNEQKIAAAEKKLESLYAGNVAQPRGANGDAVGREMRAMAEADLKGKIRAIGKKVGDFDKKVWAEVVAKQVASNEESYRMAAEAKLAIKPAAVETTDDVMALLGTVTHKDMLDMGNTE